MSEPTKTFPVPNIPLTASMVPLRGIPLLEGFSSTDLPPELYGNEVTNGCYFLAIPPTLLTSIEREISPSPFRGELRELELQFAQICQINKCVGYFQGNPVNCLELQPSLPLPPASEFEWMGFNDAQIAQVRRTLIPRLDFILNAARGYAGWLVTNTTFRAEHDALFERWSAQILEWGLAGVGRIVVVPGPTHLPRANVGDDFVEFETAFRLFLTRWRLTGMSGPMLPNPMRAMMAGSFPIAVLQQLMEAGGLFNLPDTFPIPSRDELRGLLQHALRPTDNVEHLVEWHDIVRASNPAKSRIERFGRIRELCHYWQILHQRHGAGLVRNLDHLRRAFAGYLGTSEETIKSDLMQISKRLGKDWAEHRIPLTALA